MLEEACRLAIQETQMTLSNMPKLVTIFGGSGFVGRHIVRVLAKRGYRIRVAVRRPDPAQRGAGRSMSYRLGGRSALARMTVREFQMAAQNGKGGDLLDNATPSLMSVLTASII